MTDLHCRINSSASAVFSAPKATYIGIKKCSRRARSDMNRLSLETMDRIKLHQMVNFKTWRRVINNIVKESALDHVYKDVTSFYCISYYSNVRLISKLELEQNLQSTILDILASANERPPTSLRIQ